MQRAVLVLGMHRSGTSTVAGVLNRLGVPFGPQLLPANTDNPKGFYEHSGVVALHDELLWALGYRWDDPRPLPAGFQDDPRVTALVGRLEQLLARDFRQAPVWGIKDPRLCRLLPVWLPMLQRLGVAPRCIIVLRHPAGVAASLQHRNGFGADHCGALWLAHLLDAERLTRGLERMRIGYTELLQNWQDAAGRMGRLIGQDGLVGPEAAAAEIGEFIAADLNHSSGESFQAFGPWCAPHLEAAYGALRLAADAGLPPLLDAVSDRMSQAQGYALAAYEPVIGQRVAEIRQREAELAAIRSAWSYRAARPLRALGRALRGNRI